MIKFKYIKTYPDSPPLNIEIIPDNPKEIQYFSELALSFPEFWEKIEVKEDPKPEKYYSIPISWQSYTRITVKGINLEDAIIKALNDFLSTPDSNYIEDSFEIDDIIKEETGEDFDINKCLNNLF